MEGLLPILLGGFVLYMITQGLVKAPGQALGVKFRNLGDMNGMNKDQVIAAVGHPTSVSAGAGYQLLQWQATGYHIAIQFTPGGDFIGVTHEYAA